VASGRPAVELDDVAEHSPGLRAGDGDPHQLGARRAHLDALVRALWPVDPHFSARRHPVFTPAPLPIGLLGEHVPRSGTCRNSASRTRPRGRGSSRAARRETPRRGACVHHGRSAPACGWLVPGPGDAMATAPRRKRPVQSVVGIRIVGSVWLRRLRRQAPTRGKESDRACHGRWQVGMLRPRVAHRRLRGARCSEEGP
jgi:hypothetical protein